MEPREIDAAIAEHVLGWHREKVPHDVNGENGGTDILIEPGKTLGTLGSFVLPSKGAIGLAYFVPRYSALYDEAISLSKRYKPPRYYTRLTLTDTGKWRCDIELHGGDGPVCSAVHKDMRLAICLCVIEAGKREGAF